MANTAGRVGSYSHDLHKVVDVIIKELVRTCQQSLNIGPV